MQRQPYKSNRNGQWNRTASHAQEQPYHQLPPPPPPPPPPPVEISTTTKSKLQKFQFKPPRRKTDDKDSAEPEAKEHEEHKPIRREPQLRPQACPKGRADGCIADDRMAGPVTATRASASSQSQKGSRKGHQGGNQKSGHSSGQSSGRISHPTGDATVSTPAKETTTTSRVPIKPAADADATQVAELAETSGSDKENASPTTADNGALPCTQPDKITPAVSVTPEFLSIHVKTPRARFVWQDLAGTPGTPRIKESLGLSPNAKLSWMPEQAQALSPEGPKQGTKRTRSSSPPSSPTNSRSKRVAENVQKFKEVMASATTANLALESKFPRKRNALTRHRTEVGRSTARAGATDPLGIDPAGATTPQDGLSPRTAGFRRSVSCNTIPTKRQRIGSVEPTLPEYGAREDRGEGLPPQGRRSRASSRRATTPHAAEPREDHEMGQPDNAPHVHNNPSPPALQRLSLTVDTAAGDPSLPDTESVGNGDPQAVPEAMADDAMSDFGDDFFDDDILAELDASLVPETEPMTIPAAEDEQSAPQPDRPPPAPLHPNPTKNENRGEFDDLDDVFAETDHLITDTNSDQQADADADADAEADTIVNAEPARPACASGAGGGVGDMEDMFGDDFGEDFDFEAAEMAATQAVKSSATPWVNSQVSSQRRRAIQRYLVADVVSSSYEEKGQVSAEKILVLRKDRDKTGTTRTVHLRGDWYNTSASTKAYVHVLGEFDSAGACVVDNEHNMLILHPDQLVSSTVVADSFECMRRAVLQDRVKATSEASAPLVYGTLLHEIFQAALMANKWDTLSLNVVIDNTIEKHIEDLYTIRIEPNAAREHLLTKTCEMQAWAKQFVSSTPKPDAVAEGRGHDKINMCVSKLLDVEEHVWSPMYGLKGNIDATVQVTMHPVRRPQDSTTLTVPFELKTGKHPSAKHTAQTVLYNLLLSDRYDLEIVYGVLYYMETSHTLRVPTVRNELRHMIMERNELACYIRERSVQLPPMLKKQNACGRCYAQTSCFVYHKLADGGNGETSGMDAKFDEVVGHLTPRHQEFFLKWEDLITKEEKESQKLRRELWTMLSTEREKLGRCFANVIIQEGSAQEDVGNSKINRFRYTLVKENPAPGFSFMDSQLAVGEPIVISDEEGHFALALGFVTAVHKQRIDVAVDRRLHNARIRQPGFDEQTNQVFAGIMETGGPSTKKQIKMEHGTQSPSQARSSRSSKKDVVRYRLDKDEFSNGMATVRNNLVQVMAGHRVGLREIRELVVDLVPPKFKATSTQYVIDDTKAETLNIDQQRAIDKVMSAEDYALVLGMPGTGKTTTIAHIISALVSQGKSVLLTSYTHTAVDNILLKLKTSKTPILRLGAPAKVHPEVQDFAILAGEPKTSFDAIRHAWHDTPIVATTCLGINHPLFSERMFDYCIVDEASQITLPICLGPIRMARTFVLVGDHNQLPPLVQNEEARLGGLDVSLFKLLSDTHPDSVVNLEHQYRMCEDIMTLSNTLIYNGRLKCGTEELRLRCLQVPDMAELYRHHHNSDSIARLTPSSFCAMGGPSCWLRDLLRPETRVAFINTDAIDGSREEYKGNRTVNPCEARLVSQLVEGLLTVGVPASDIGVMTHYRSQLSLLKHQLRGLVSHHNNSGEGGGGIEMHTADRFQGRDKEVVVLSLVRNNEACSIGDLLKDWRRINVAFTRAKTKLLVVGSRSTLQGSVSQDKAVNKSEKSAKGERSKVDEDNIGEQMLARFVGLMEERHWIYDLPSDALEDHLFEEYPTTQAGSLGQQSRQSPETARTTGKTTGQSVAVKTEKDAARAPLVPSNRQPPQPRTGRPGKPSLLVASRNNNNTAKAGKENRQPLKRAGVSANMLLKGKPILQGIWDDVMSGR